jgi:hypothetical protein
MRIQFTFLPALLVAFGLCVFLLSVSSRAQQDQPPGLLGRWSFDTPGGSIATDDSGNRNDAELQNVQWVSGEFGTALRFTGTNSFGVLPELPELDGSDTMTAEAWVLWEGTGQYPNILSSSVWSPGGFLIFVSNDTCTFRLGRPGHKANRPGDQWRETSVPFLSNLPMGRWVHLAATFERPLLTAYVNGEKVSSANWDYPVGHSGDILLGKWHGQISHKGLIDEVRIYRTALTPEQIRESYRSTSPGRDSADYRILENTDNAEPVVTLQTDHAVVTIDEMARIASITSRPDGRELLKDPLPIAVIRSENRRRIARRCTFENGNLKVGFLRLEGTVTLKVDSNADYLRFEIAGADTPPIDEISFLQASAAPSTYVGRMAGLAADDTHGLCIRSLNLQTDLRIGGNPPRIEARATAEYGIVGAAAALTAGPIDAIRPALKAITDRENQPKSLLGGAWSMDAPELRGSYLFAGVSEGNVDEWIDVADRGGFRYIHFSGWWQSLGHYQPRTSLFPNGLAGMRRTVARIHSAGLKAGMHTLTGCISTSDPWVTPVPDPRLVADASYTLAQPMNVDDETVFVTEKPGNHDVVWSYSGNGNVLRIGNELIHYTAISHTEPYAFQKCVRGAFGTTPQAHPEGAAADHLQQRYLAFYPGENTTLVDEVADAIANVYNTCGMDQIYMDGSEGMRGWHAIDVMRNAIYSRLGRPALVEASCHGHNNWWFHSRLGAWDHPKWAFRQFTDMHCASAKRYRRTDFMEPQMGWWALIGPSTISRGILPEEVEYFVAKTMAMDSAMSIQGVNVGRRPPNARQEEYFTTIGRYERLRLARYFDDSTLQRVGEPGADVRLTRLPDGQWTLLPVQFAKHRITALGNGSEAWSAHNPYAEQPPEWRLEALYGVQPYDAPAAVTLVDPAKPEDFTIRGNADGVRSSFGISPDAQVGSASFKFTAANTGAPPRGAWCRAGIAFSPYLDIRPCDALGLWVHGDGKGEVLNVQLQTPREHHHCYAEHYITVDFTGWRYIEMPFRERDADRYHDYEWPYFSQHGIFRNALDRAHVSHLTLYLNNIPAGESVEVLVSPIKALPTASVELREPVLVLNDRSMSVPFDLPSGHYVEIGADGMAAHFSERGRLLERAVLGAMPSVRGENNSLRFDCAPPETLNARAEVTLITHGQPMAERRPPEEVDWTALKHEFDPPKLILRQDGRENVWKTASRTGRTAELNVEIEIEKAGSGQAAFELKEALPVDACNTPGLYQLSKVNTYAKYAYDADSKGVPAKPGVTHRLTSEQENAKSQDGALLYTATSNREDARGWAAKGRRFDPPLDLSKCAALAFWLHGDANGELFKVQLRDENGKWHDMVTRVDFRGWRFIQFPFDDPKLDLEHIEYLIYYYNAIPAGQTVQCIVDEVRGLRDRAVLSNPVLTVGDTQVEVTADLISGRRLLLSKAGCQIIGPGHTEPRTVPVNGSLPELEGGTIPVSLNFAEGAGPDFRVWVRLTKTYAE